jgi:hypothetical protein
MGCRLDRWGRLAPGGRRAPEPLGTPSPEGGVMGHRIQKTCFYCDSIYSTSRSAPGDHFPVPKRHGGAECVPCCQQCHSLKDRMKLGDWNFEMVGKVIADFPKLSRETRIFLAKCMVAVQDINAMDRQKVASPAGFKP